MGAACMAELVEKHGGVAGVDTRLGRQLVDTDHAASPGPGGHSPRQQCQIRCTGLRLTPSVYQYRAVYPGSASPPPSCRAISPKSI